jgi:hypothetical protein
MCRSIKTLRPPFTETVTAEDVEAAARQYVRKVAGMRHPSRLNEEAFAAGVEEIALATQKLLASLAPPRATAKATGDAPTGPRSSRR